MIVYEVIKEFYLVQIADTVTVGSVVYAICAEDSIVVAVDPPPAPDPLTNYIGGVSFDSTCFCTWAAGVGAEFLVNRGTLPDPGGGAGTQGAQGWQGWQGPGGPNVTANDIEITTAANGLIQRSPDGTRWRQTVDNGGGTTWTPLP